VSGFIGPESGLPELQDNLISSVKSDRMEKRDERVPPVDTSFRR
jgi:hypothetical protein